MVAKIRHQRFSVGGFAILYLVAALAAVSVSGAGLYAWQSHRIGKLTAELALEQRANEGLREVAVFNQGVLDSTIKEVKACADLRQSAEDRAHEASVALEEAQRVAFKRAQKRINEIKNDNAAAVCSVPVPARTVELLIAAAYNANTGEDSP